MSRVVCDEGCCSGCLACIVACLDRHYDGHDENAVSLRIYEMRKSRKSDFETYITRSCHHCKDAPCVKACRFGALVKNDTGFVIPLNEKCKGCKMCFKACPYDAIRFDAAGKIVKCDGCYVRVSMGYEPACVRACNTGALSVVDD